MDNHQNKMLSLRQFLLTYLIPMFSVALVLVLVSYLNERQVSTANERVKTLEEELQVAGQRQQEIREAYDALVQALTGEGEEKQAAMEKLGTLHERLSAEGEAVYRKLLESVE